MDEDSILSLDLSHDGDHGLAWRLDAQGVWLMMDFRADFVTNRTRVSCGKRSRTPRVLAERLFPCYEIFGNPAKQNAKSKGAFMAHFTPNLPVGTEEERMALARKIARAVAEKEGYSGELNIVWEHDRRRYTLYFPHDDGWLFSPSKHGLGEGVWRLALRYHDDRYILDVLDPFMK